MYSLRARTAPVMFAIVSYDSTPDKPVVLHYSSCMYQLYIPVVYTSCIYQLYIPVVYTSCIYQLYVSVYYLYKQW